MIRDSAELQAPGNGTDAVVPEMQAYGMIGGIDLSKDGKDSLDTLPDPVAGLKAYFSKIDR